MPAFPLRTSSGGDANAADLLGAGEPHRKIAKGYEASLLIVDGNRWMTFEASAGFPSFLKGERVRRAGLFQSAP
jgi:imidazolonepropionase-like amidohydrolase